MELITLGNTCIFVVKVLGDSDLANDNSIVVYLPEWIRLLQVVPANFVIKWDMVPSADAADSQVDVTESCITMNERNVVIKDEEIDNHHRKLNQQGQEKSYNTSVLSLLVIVIEFEEIAIWVLVGEVNHINDEEVEDCCKSIPGDDLAELYWEAEDVCLSHVADKNHQAEANGISKVAHDNNTQLLELVPVSVFQCDLVECLQSVSDRNHRCVDQLQKDKLAQVMDHHTHPKNSKDYKECFTVIKQVSLTYSHVKNDLLEDELQLA